MSSIFININKSDTLEKSAIDKAVTRVAVALARQRQQGAIPRGPGLEITFLLASPELQPDFAGMRMGGYSEDDPVLRFHAAIPEHLAHSPTALRYVLAVLEDVLSNARDYFVERRIPFDDLAWRRVFEAVTQYDEDPPETAWAEYPLN